MANLFTVDFESENLLGFDGTQGDLASYASASEAAARTGSFGYERTGDGVEAKEPVEPSFLLPHLIYGDGA